MRRSERQDSRVVPGVLSYWPVLRPVLRAVIRVAADWVLWRITQLRFLRIRHYGFLANCTKKESLNHCRKLLGAMPRALEHRLLSLAERVQMMVGIDITRCPGCQNELDRTTLKPSRTAELTLRFRLRSRYVRRSDTS